MQQSMFSYLKDEKKLGPEKAKINQIAGSACVVKASLYNECCMNRRWIGGLANLVT